MGKSGREGHRPAAKGRGAESDAERELRELTAVSAPQEIQKKKEKKIKAKPRIKGTLTLKEQPKFSKHPEQVKEAFNPTDARDKVNKVFDDLRRELAGQGRKTRDTPLLWLHIRSLHSKMLEGLAMYSTLSKSDKAEFEQEYHKMFTELENERIGDMREAMQTASLRNRKQKGPFALSEEAQEESQIERMDAALTASNTAEATAYEEDWKRMLAIKERAERMTELRKRLAKLEKESWRNAKDATVLALEEELRKLERQQKGLPELIEPEFTEADLVRALQSDREESIQQEAAPAAPEPDLATFVAEQKHEAALKNENPETDAEKKAKLQAIIEEFPAKKADAALERVEPFEKPDEVASLDGIRFKRGTRRDEPFVGGKTPNASASEAPAEAVAEIAGPAVSPEAAAEAVPAAEVPPAAPEVIAAPVVAPRTPEDEATRAATLRKLRAMAPRSQYDNKRMLVLDSTEGVSPEIAKKYPGRGAASVKAPKGKWNKKGWLIGGGTVAAATLGAGLLAFFGMHKTANGIQTKDAAAKKPDAKPAASSVMHQAATPSAAPRAVSSEAAPPPVVVPHKEIAPVSVDAKGEGADKLFESLAAQLHSTYRNSAEIPPLVQKLLSYKSADEFSRDMGFEKLPKSATFRMKDAQFSADTFKISADEKTLVYIDSRGVPHVLIETTPEGKVQKVAHPDFPMRDYSHRPGR